MIILFSPLLLFRYTFPKKLYKYFILICVLTIIHWNLLDGKCIISIIQKKYGGLKKTKTDSPFSEKYLKWLYKPLTKLFGLKWNNYGIGKICVLHWLINFLIIWYFTFKDELFKKIIDLKYFGPIINY